MLDRICRDAVAQAGLWGIGVTVRTPTGPEPVVFTTPVVRELEVVQYVLGEGPTGEALASARPVLVHDLADQRARWVQFADAAMARGVGAVYAFPLQLGAVRVGVLTEYCATGRRLDPTEVVASIDLAERLRDLLLDVLDDRPPAELLASPLLRSEVFQAQGMVMVALGVTLADALVRLRAAAYAEGIDLNDLASQIVSGRRPMLNAGDDPE